MTDTTMWSTTFHIISWMSPISNHQYRCVRVSASTLTEVLLKWCGRVEGLGIQDV